MCTFHRFLLATAALLLLALAFGQVTAFPKHNCVLKEGYVPDKATACAVARASALRRAKCSLGLGLILLLEGRQ